MIYFITIEPIERNKENKDLDHIIKVSKDTFL